MLNEANRKTRDRVEEVLLNAGIEFRRGLSGGGNQLRQPYLRGMDGLPSPEDMPVTDHLHHHGWYIGNYPDLEAGKIDSLGKVLAQI